MKNARFSDPHVILLKSTSVSINFGTHQMLIQREAPNDSDAYCGHYGIDHA